jgi:hypothetical protein
VADPRQNPGKSDAGALTGMPKAETEDSLEHVLDAWSAEPSSRQRYDRLRLERRDGSTLEVLIDSDTARDLGDKLTITAARARHRTRGASGVPEDKTIDPGDAEDFARARKVFDLAGFTFADRGFHADALRVLADEFSVSREDVKKAHAMLDEQQTFHVQRMANLAESYESKLEEFRAELESVKADRANLIAEAAERDIEAGERGDGHSRIDLSSDPSEPAPR